MSYTNEQVDDPRGQILDAAGGRKLLAGAEEFTPESAADAEVEAVVMARPVVPKVLP